MKHSHFPSLLAAAALCAAGVGLYAVPARAAENLVLDANENLFYVLAAINAAGFDEGIKLPDNSPLRQQVRDFIQQVNPAVLPELKRFFLANGHRKTAAQDLSQYISYALSVTGQPDFGWRARDVEIPPDAKSVEGLTPLLIELSRQVNLPAMWRKAKPVYEQELQRYHAPLVAMTGKIDGYLRVSTAGYLGRRFQVYIDLLANPKQVQTRNYGDDAFVIVTPAPDPPMYDIRHAYLHFEIDPIMIKYGIDLQQKRSLLDLVQLAPMDERYKEDFVLLATECLIKAVEARLDKNKNAVDMAMRQGFVLTQFFAEQLPGFEQQQQGLRFYAEDMVHDIDLKRESARIASVKFDLSQLQRKANQVVVGEVQRSASAKTLEEAESQYSAKQLDKARDLFLKALEQAGSEAEHSQAWFGMAKIAALQKQPDAAVKLFDKALGSSPDPFTKSWSYVYLGRLAQAANEQAKALDYFKQSLAVEGGSKMALDIARKELQTAK